MRPTRILIGCAIWWYGSIALANDPHELKYQFQRRGKPYIHAFVLAWTGPDSNLQSITVTDPDSGAIIQKIAVPQDRVKLVWKEIQAEHPKETRESIFDQLDFNFDRFADIRLLREYSGKVGKKLYLIYTFDKAKNQYVLNDDISALTAPIPNPKTKRVESTTLGGFGGFESTTQHFSVTPFGKLVLEARIESKVVDALRLAVQKDVFALHDGQLKLVCQRVEEPEGIKRQIMGSSEDCAKYLTPPKPKMAE